jgi:formate-dependent nitrite reductase membrane component NrfD
MLFGACAFLSWYSERSGTLAKLIAAAGGLLGFFVAGYTGVLLSVTNRPIWADTPWLGALFLASGASTGAAALMLLARRRGAPERSMRWLASFDTQALIVELIILIVFIVSLWPIRQVWLSFWGLLLLVGVVLAGILWPLRLHYTNPGTGFRNPAVMVLLGGFLLRVVVLLASNSIAVHHVASGGR